MEVVMVEAEAGEGDGRTTRNCDTKAFHGIICNVMNENTSCSRASTLFIIELSSSAVCTF
jgi:hypothetical protein